MIFVFIGAVVALVTSAAMTPAARWAALHIGHIDLPNDRSSHDRPTPRTGGWAIVAGIAAGITAAGAFHDRGLLVLLVAALFLILLAIIDERTSVLPQLVRLVLQFAIAIAAVLVAHIALQRLDLPYRALPLAWAAVPLSVFWLAGMTNAYNFMDGLNGIASVEAIVCGATMASLAMQSGDGPAAALALVLAAAALGFLPWNLPSGSIFMGDTGSTTLGFLFAALVLRLAHHGVSPIAAALPLLPFLLDSGITLARRLARGERVLTAHRSHFYQRLQQQGWSHAAVTSLYGVLAVCCGLAAQQWPRLAAPKQLALLAALLALHGAVFAAIERGRRRLAANAMAS
jgi:UDP-GlcNAc:undecaprenyl-phosphate GlcNAc-1-phosphate transferase